MLIIANDTRPGRGENQDALGVMHHPGNAKLILGAVADGLGGQPGGKAAAQLACKTILQAASRCLPGSLMWERIWRRLLVRADRAVCEDANAGFTTLVAFALLRGRLCGVSCGDSALMAVTARDVKVLTEGQKQRPPLGTGNAPAFSYKFALHPPWRVLAMTDGVWKYAGWDQIWEFALAKSHPDLMIESICKAAKRTGGCLQDDFTVLVVNEDGKPPA